jgi:hypothetical protein
MALSYNSTRNNGAINNTSAGVRGGATFKMKIWVRVIKEEKTVSGEEIQLLFDPVPDEGYEEVKFDKLYGNVE